VKVYLDSQYIGEAPSVFPDIGSGTHTIEFRKDGFASLRKNITINEGKTTNIMVVLEYIPPVTTDATSSFPYLPVLVVIIGLVAIAIGGYYFWSEKRKKDWDIDDDTEAEDTRDQDSAVRDPVIKDTVIRNPKVPDTVVRVTILKDIPDKETGDNDTNDKRE
jgi:hypothetical protein